jgi:hypothetical protein
VCAKKIKRMSILMMSEALTQRRQIYWNGFEITTNY